MGKKRTRSATTSKGERRSVVAGVKLVRQARTELQKGLNKLEAWKKGKNPWVTVPGPSKKEAMVRVRSNSVWGDPKRRFANIYAGKPEE